MNQPIQKLRISLVQMNCEKAALGQNLDRISATLAEARQRQVDIIAFPEMSISGYADPTRYPQAVLNLDGPEVHDFLARTRGSQITVLAGLIEANPAGKPFITHLVARDGQLLGSYRKITIQDEEEAWFSPGETVPIFNHRESLPFGLSICADISNEAVFAGCAQQGARIVFEVAAPGLYGEQENRNWQSGFDWWQDECQRYLSRYAQTFQLWIAVATQAGRTIDEDFPGGAFVFAPDGRRLFASPDGSPGTVTLEIELDRNGLSAI